MDLCTICGICMVSMVSEKIISFLNLKDKLELFKDAFSLHIPNAPQNEELNSCE